MAENQSAIDTAKTRHYSDSVIVAFPSFSLYPGLTLLWWWSDEGLMRYSAFKILGFTPKTLTFYNFGLAYPNWTIFGYVIVEGLKNSQNQVQWPWTKGQGHRPPWSWDFEMAVTFLILGVQICNWYQG